MSDFFISGFSDSGLSPLSQPSALEVRGSRLVQLAQLELARFEFGLQDRVQGKSTQVARDLEIAVQRVGRLSHPRAKQRAHAYTPIEGREHCPHCWVFVGQKHALHIVPGLHADTASCSECGSQYQLAAS